MKFRTHQTITVFAGMRTLVFAHHCEGFLRNGSHSSDITFVTHVENGANMETTDGGMCIPGTFYAISRENIVKPCGIFG